MTTISTIVSAHDQLATTSGLLTGLALVLVSACVYFHVKKFTYWSSRGVPGPLPWPVFGTSIYYLLEDKLEVDTKWRNKYGRTFGLYEGYSPLLRTTDNEVIKQIYVKKFNSFTDRHNEFIYNKVTRNWLLWSEGARWSNQRALVSPMFSSSKMRNMLATMTTCVERFLDQVRRSQTQQQQTVTLEKKDLSNMTLDVIATSFFGLKLDTYAKKRSEFFTKAMEFSRLSLSRFLVWSLVPRHVARALVYDLFPPERFEYFDQLTKRTIEERRRTSTGRGDTCAGQSKDFVQLFLDARLPETYESIYDTDDDRVAHYNDQTRHDQLEREQREQTNKATLFKRFSDLEIRGQMTFMFVAGFETTATTLAFCTYELAHQANTQSRLFKELEIELGSDGLEELRLAHTRANSSEHFYSKLMSLQVLDAFVSETLRLYSPLVEHNRRATELVELTITSREGQESRLELPKGMPVSTQGFVLQRDPQLFESPEEHRLERFLPENRDKMKTCSFMPFGVGPRHCAGMRFALLEIKLALVKLLASYTLAPGPKSLAYPPRFQRNPVFLLLEHSDFQLTPRANPPLVAAASS